MTTDVIRPISQDHPIIQMLVDDIIERHERLSLGTFTVYDVKCEKDPPFVFVINTHDTDE